MLTNGTDFVFFPFQMEHIMHIAVQSEITFLVHPLHFVVHMPHPPTFVTVNDDQLIGQRLKNEATFNEALEAMQEDRFVPVTSFPHLCLPKEVQKALAVVIDSRAQEAKLLEMAEVVELQPARSQAALPQFPAPDEVSNWECPLDIL